MGIETNIQLALLTSGLRNQFSEFILQAEVNEIDSNTIIEIDRDALFINFNYTNTLEKHYLISSDNILYIHGVASNKQEIILGHATDPEIFYDKKSEPKFPSEASKEIIEQWDDYMSDHHNPMYEDCVDAVNGYFLSSFKDTTKIIDEYSQYFSNLSDVEQIIIYGHSMSDIDMAYFEKISSIVKSDTQWLVTYYDSNKKEEIECVLEHLNISSENYQLIQW
jgi:regulator of sigma D